jgi:hypothetical protein
MTGKASLPGHSAIFLSRISETPSYFVGFTSCVLLSLTALTFIGCNKRFEDRLGHIIRINEIRTVKKIFEETLGGRRGRGRSRLRWIDDVEEDLRNMGIKRRGTKVLDRVEWASVINEAKARLKGP